MLIQVIWKVNTLYRGRKVTLGRSHKPRTMTGKVRLCEFHLRWNLGSVETFHPSLSDGVGARVRMSHRISGIYWINSLSVTINIIVMAAAVSAAIVTAAVTAAAITYQDFSD